MLRTRLLAVLLAATLAAGCTSSDDPEDPDGAAPSDTTTATTTKVKRERERERRIPPRPARLVRKGPPSELTVLQYNIQYADAGLNGVAADIAAVDADVVLLNEIDDRRPTGGRLQARYLARRLGMDWAYDPNGAVSRGFRGNAVLTTMDISYVRRFDLPTPDDTEKRGLMNVTVTDGRLQLDVWTTHLNPRFGTLAQARRVRTFVGAPRCTTILGADLNALPSENPAIVMRNHLTDLWRERGDGPGTTNRFGTRRIDYLYYRDAEPVAVEVLDRASSDHHRLVGTFLVDPRRNC